MRQGDGWRNTMSRCGPTVNILGLCIKDTHERRDMYEDERNLASELQSVTLEDASLFLGLQPRITCAGLLVCEYKTL